MEDTVPQDVPYIGLLHTGNHVVPSTERNVNHLDTDFVEGSDKADEKRLQLTQNKTVQRLDTKDEPELTFSMGSYTEAPMPVYQESIYYNMNHQMRGIVMIFSHRKFDVLGLAERKYTDADCALLEETWKSYGFQVQCHTDLTRKQIYDVLEQASEQDYSDCDCLVICVLTHGKPGNLYAHDVLYKEEYLWIKFTSDNCPTLAGKPKIFILEAFQGNKVDPGVNFDNNASCSLPDFVIAHATPEGYKAWLNKSSGSWFIKTLCEELKCKSGMDLLSVLTYVNRRVGTENQVLCSEHPEFNGTRMAMSVTNTLTRSLKLYSPENVSFNSALFYINKRNIGKVIIFNHYTFDTTLEHDKREGTQRDCENLQAVFKKIGYKIYTHNDLTKQEIVEVLQQANAEDYSDYNCLIIVILTHGNAENLYAKDGLYERRTVFEYFTVDRCPSLAGKPKVFLIEACRGNKANPSFQLMDIHNSDKSYYIPAVNDFLIARFTLCGNNSCYNEEEGSLFIQELCKQLQEKRNLNLDLITLMTVVNKNIGLKYDSNFPSKTNKQAVCVTSLLSRLVKF